MKPMRIVAMNLGLHCREILGNHNNFSDNDIETGSFYDAMAAVIDELLLENKIENIVEAYDFKNAYFSLKGKNFNYFRRENIDIFKIFNEFRCLIGKDEI